MKKKIVYIAHPISGDIEGNLADLRRILRIINIGEYNIIPCSPYYADIVSLDDNIPEERARGIENDIALIKSGMFNELWLTGTKISYGMQCEEALFRSIGLPVRDYINKF